MNNFDKTYSKVMETIYSSIALNEYDENSEEEDPEKEALNAAASASSVPEDQQTSDQKNLAKAANKYNQAATKKLSKSQSALK
jgi:hypothetical protein